MSKKTRRALALASVLLLFFLIWHFLPKWLASQTKEQIASSIAQAFSSAALVSVQLSPGSLPSWAQGQLQDLKIEARGLRTKDGFPIAAFFFEARLLRLDLAKLLKGKMELLASHQANATVVLAEAELTSYLQKKVQSLSDLRMELRAGKATVNGTAKFLGQQVKLSIAGKFSPQKGDLRFTPTDFFVANLKLPRFLLNNLGQAVEFTIPLVALPLPLKLESVRIENGNAYLAGRGDLK